jgi:Cellulase (glycosyl hydrolase family 5)
MSRRFVRLALLVSLAALVLPVAAQAASRLWIGFQDDPNFRWRSIRSQVRDRSVDAEATVLRTTVYWNLVAPRRPANPDSPFDPTYRWADLDEFTYEAQRRGQEVMFAVWGTPSWANSGTGRNRMPRNVRDLTDFCKALADRYSGRHPGIPFVRFYGVWNEPNLNLFLTPQFDARGRSVSPNLYARLYRAAYAGIKAGNPRALVAIGETSPRGRDKRIRGQSDTHSPGRFAQLLARNRGLRFDAYAHHPYSTPANTAPTLKTRFPNVTFAMLPTFEKKLDQWFHRRNIRIWITEYGHETRPPDPRGVTYAQQARYARSALLMASKDPRIQLFIWFVLRDDRSMPWQSGLMDYSGNRKPAFSTFSALARVLDARNPVITVRRGQPRYSARFSALPIQAKLGPNTRVGMTYRVYFRGRFIAVGQFESRTDIDGWVPFFFRFPATTPGTYTMRLEANDIVGDIIRRTFTIVVR